jgi:hypothetical protein
MPGARDHLGVALRDNGDVAFLELDRFECDVADERYPARAAGDDVILDHVLSTRHDLVGNLCRGRRFCDPRRFGGDVEEHRP